MLLITCMRTTRVAVLLSSLVASAALADNAPIAPDFVGTAPPAHIDRSLAASSRMNRIEPADVIAFQLGSAKLAADGLDQVDHAARWLRLRPGHHIVLEGHTDKLGTMPYNEDLATRRIQSVRARLIRDGIPSDRIVMITYGETQAITPDNPSDRRVVMFASNRPVRDIVTAQLDHRRALVASWTEHGAMMQMQNGLGRRTGTVVGTR
jgi:outer membrane protein OmpA-like peptidoglycan-associated protein